MSENPRDLKVQMKKRIIGMLNSRPDGMEADKLVALLELDTGFGEKVIKRTLHNLEILEVISTASGRVYLKKQ